MKQTLFNRMPGIVMLSLVAISFTNCTKNVKEDNQAMQSMKMRSEKSLNLTKEYTANLMALNHSGVSGTASLMLEGNMLTVKIDAMGLEANKLHPQHIHGFTDNTRNSTCPDMSADTNGDGLVDLPEGLPSYGPVLLELTPFPTADANGEIHYTKTFTIEGSVLPLQNRAIVLHGLTVMDQYWPTLPVACAQIKTK
jgi:hypothetical protein